MNNKQLERKAQLELDHYFECSRQQKCPSSMKKNLYRNLKLNNKQGWASFRLPEKLAMAGISLLFVTSVMFKINSVSQQDELMQAQLDLQVAMHYMNRISFKPLTAITNDGIKPGLIKPLMRSVALL
jgi:hypothetical protein